MADGDSIGWLVWFPNLPTPNSFWSGEENLTYTVDGVSRTFLPAYFVNISSLETRDGVPDRRLRASFAATDAVYRAAIMQDVGPTEVYATWVKSPDAWATVHRIGDLRFYGFLSNPTIENGVYSIDIETWAGDIDRGDPRMWSDEDHQARHSGDKGLEYVKQLSSRVVEVDWP